MHAAAFAALVGAGGAQAQIVEPFRPPPTTAVPVLPPASLPPTTTLVPTIPLAPAPVVTPAPVVPVAPTLVTPAPVHVVPPLPPEVIGADADGDSEACDCYVDAAEPIYESGQIVRWTTVRKWTGKSPSCCPAQ